MKSEAATPEQYIKELPADRKEAIIKLRNTIRQNLPPGFKEEMSYGMIGYVVPHTVYAAGYHCSPRLPLPFINIASQKNGIAFYHMALYASPELHSWFKKEYAKQTPAKLDMGKSCVRFRKPDQIPYELIGRLAGKMTVDEWIAFYEKNIKRV